MPNKKKKHRYPSQPLEPWSMHPSRHEAVLGLLREAELAFDYFADDQSDCETQYDTNIMGRFTCRNRQCAVGVWTSKRVAITIRMYPDAKYNAKVYHQRCNACEQLGTLELDESYEERIAYRLKVWSGIRMERPPYFGESRAPHRSELCEGCKAGHCKGAAGMSEYGAV